MDSENTDGRRRIRPFRDADEADLAGVWHRAGLGAYTYFKAIKFGVSPPPESAPDVKYHWRP